ncbi:MAG: alpha/beta family hydrolase [Calditrichaceae bacterium]
MWETIKIKIDEQRSTTGLFTPGSEHKPGIILAHGAGGDMRGELLSAIHEYFAGKGYSFLRFNFLYKDLGRKAPDRQPVLMDTYQKAISFFMESSRTNGKLIIGGKSMGGRIASYLSPSMNISGLLFLGYPLHPAGHPEKLRDEHLYDQNLPMLFIQGTKDALCNYDLMTNVSKRIGPSAKLIPVKEGNHSFSVPKRTGRSQDEIFNSIVDNADRWIQSNFYQTI